MATGQWCVKGSGVTIGSDTDLEGKIVSEIAISGGETTKTVLSSMDGSNFTCFGNQNDFELSFDMVVTGSDNNPATYVYGSGTTVSTTTTIDFSNDGAQSNDVVIDLGANSDGYTCVYTFSGCQGVTGVPKFGLGSAHVMTVNLTCNPDQVSQVIDTSP